MIPNHVVMYNQSDTVYWIVDIANREKCFACLVTERKGEAMQMQDIIATQSNRGDFSSALWPRRIRVDER